MNQVNDWMKVYGEGNADLGFLEGKVVSVIGYGSQGAAQALCMRDSGLEVLVGARRNGPSWRRARTDGFKVAELGEAARRGDVVCMLISDTSQPEVYYKFVHPHMKKGKTLYFSHGFSITHGFIKPPKNTDVILVAPHGPGKQLRELYLEGKGLPALMAIHRDASGKAKKIALALAKACGFTRAGVFEAPFDHETYADLFAEQAVLCGVVGELVRSAYETLVDAGIEPELAWFCCLYELKLTVDLINQEGLEGMWSRVSETARYGGRTRGPRVIGRESKKELRRVLREIRSGDFARELAAEYRKRMPLLRRAKREGMRGRLERTDRLMRRSFRL